MNHLVIFIFFIYRIFSAIYFIFSGIYYWHKDNTKNISKKLHDIIYPNTKF